MSVSLEKEEDDDPFKLIQRGNAFEAASDHWRSSEFYTRASISLRRRADDLSSQIRSSNKTEDDIKANVEEQKKVISLYRAQSLEYMYKARHCLMQALQFENDQDRSNTLEVAKSGVGSLDPLYSMISDEEGRKRRLIFETLFTSGSIDSDDGDVEESAVQKVDTDEVAIQEELSTNDTVEPAATINSNTISSAQQAPESSTSTNPQPVSNANGIDDRQQSIEARLAELDTSLLPNVPPPFISGSRTSNGKDNNQNRLNEIQKGLKGLGISLPDNSGKKDLISDNDNTEDQIKLIVQQAKDEARFEKGLHDNNDSNNDDDGIIDENDSIFEGFIDDEEDENYDIDVLLSKAEKLVSGIDSSAKDGKEGSTSSELVQITKLQALLLEARLCLEMVNVKSSSNNEQIPLADENNLNLQVIEEQERNEEDGLTPNSDSETLAAKEKARVLIQSAQDCLNDLLTHWK